MRSFSFHFYSLFTSSAHKRAWVEEFDPLCKQHGEQRQKGKQHERGQRQGLKWCLTTVDGWHCGVDDVLKNSSFWFAW